MFGSGAPHWSDFRISNFKEVVMPSARNKLRILQALAGPLGTGLRCLGFPVSAVTAAIVLPATSWLCAWVDLAPESVLMTAAIAQMLWLVIWVQRCKSVWEQPPGRELQNANCKMQIANCLRD